MSYESLVGYLPVGIFVIISALVLWGMHWLLLGRNAAMGTQARIPRQVVLFLSTATVLLTVVVLFPMSDTTRGQIITLIGLVITGVIALASTTFVANVMAGLMLNIVKSFSPGDFIRVGEKFGRVTERGLFHTEIQTEDRDLATLPNLHLATNPLTVVHQHGTIISAELSLGYDIPRTRIEELLKQAALKVDLQDPFVLVVALNDFSVSYKVCGFLSDITSLITARSNLKKYVLDVLHENNIEIVSPGFIYQRQQPSWQPVIPQTLEQKLVDGTEEVTPESMIFDKANEAAEKEQLRSQVDDAKKAVDKLSRIKKTVKGNDKKAVEMELKIAEEEQQDLEKKLRMQDQDEGSTS